MAWYRAGTVSVTNGSAVVTGANTDFVSNTQQGEAFLGPDGRVYEVAQVFSATQLTLGGNYQGASAGGQGYALMPTSSFARDLALGAAQLLNTFAAVRDGIGAGLIPGGSVTTPGLRFANDQDTGVALVGPNSISLVAGGAGVLVGRPTGVQIDFLGVGTATPTSPVEIRNPGGAGSNSGLRLSSASSALSWQVLAGIPNISNDAFGIHDVARNVTPLAIDGSGNLLVGVPSASSHVIARGSTQGDLVLNVSGLAQPSCNFYSAGNGAYSGAAAAFKAAANSSSGRSINAAGTINASGADYAEYMRKAEGCGTIAKGDVCGVDRDGFLTRTWAAAVSHVVKSSDPSLVGGDVWAGHLGPRPDPIDPEPIAPGDAPPMPDDDDSEALAAWRETVAVHTALVAAYPAAHAQWASDQAAYETALEAWEANLETARQCVDRIAFCGQVPVNVTGDFAVGDYIIAVANGSGIKAIAVAGADITFDQYRRRIGKVWAVRSDRAWIDVQHG